MARIFISHSSKDNGAAIAFAQWLASEGWDDYFLDLDPQRGIAAGERWERKLNEAAYSCQAVLFLISRNWLASAECAKELQRAYKLNKQIIGVLIEDIADSDIPARILDHQYVDLARGRDHGPPLRVELPNGNEAFVTFSRSGLRKLKASLQKADIDARIFPWPPAHDPQRPPYRGMLPLEAEDAGIFFGREAPIIEVLDLIRGMREDAPPRFLAIIGASGAGKSSFLRAGILPRLSRDDRSFIVLPVVRPETKALHGASGFVASLSAAFERAGAPRSKAAVAKALDEGPQASARLLGELAEQARAPALRGERRAPVPAVILPLDQGEELFQGRGREEAARFMEMLAGLVGTDTPKLVVVVTIRSDSYEQLQKAPELDGIRQRTFSLPPLPRGAYQLVIEGPAQRLAGTDRALKIEAGLTERLLRDTAEGASSDALPLLAFTLERLYDRHGGDGDLRLDEYRSIGGIAGSIDAAVAKAFEAADRDPAVPQERDARLALLRRAMIPWLAGYDSETGSPRRQVANMRDIPAEARPLVRHLVDQRLLATGVQASVEPDADEAPVKGGRKDASGRAAGEVTVEPVHEALLRQWGLLGDWLEEDRVQLSALEGVQRARTEWEANKRDPAWLAHHAGRLEDAERLNQRPDLAAKLNDADRAYLAAARDAENQRRDSQLIAARRLAQRTALGAIAATVLFVAAAISAWYGFNQADLARQKTEEAERQAVIAQQQTEKAKEQATIATEKTAEAEQQATIAKAQKEQAEAARNAEIGARVNSVNASMRSITEKGRPDVALAVGLEFLENAPAEIRDEATAKLDGSLRHAYAQVSLPIERALADNLYRMTISPDGSLLAIGLAGSDDNKGTIYIIDAKTMTERASFRAHTDDVVSGLQFSPDSRKLAVAGGKIPTVWEAATGRKLFDLAPPAGRPVFFKRILFSADGSKIIASTNGSVVLVYDAADGKTLHEIEADTYESMIERRGAGAADDFGIADPIMAAVSQTSSAMWGASTEIEINQKTGLLAVTGVGRPDLSAQIFDVNTGELRKTLTGGVGTAIIGSMGYGKYLEFSEEADLLVAVPSQSWIKVWTLADGALKVQLPATDTTSVSLTPDKRAVISSHMDGTLVMRCIDGPAWTTAVKAHESDIGILAVYPEAKVMLSGSDDGTVKLWPLPTGGQICGGDNKLWSMRPLRTFGGHGSKLWTAIFEPVSNRVFTASRDGSVRAFPVDVVRLGSGSDGLEVYLAANFTADGKYLVAEKDYEVDVFDLASREQVLSETFESVVIGRDGKAIHFKSPRTFYVADSEFDTGYVDDDWDAGEGGRVMKGAPGGDTLLLKNDEDRHVLYSVSRQQIVAGISVEGLKLVTGSFSPDGSLFAALFEKEIGEAKRRVSLAAWDASTGKPLGVVPVETKESSLYGSRVAFSTNNTHILIGPGDDGRYDEELWIYPIKDGAIVPAPALTRGGMLDADLSPNGRHVAVTAEYAVNIFAVDGGQWLKSFQVPSPSAIRVRFSRDGAKIGVATDDRRVMVLEADDGFILAEAPLPGNAQTVGFDDKGERLAACGDPWGCIIVDLTLSKTAGAEPADFVDNLLLSGYHQIAPSDRPRFGLGFLSSVERPDLFSFKPWPLPVPVPNKLDNPAVAECDRLAAHPGDRARRNPDTTGADFEKLDAASRTACEGAFATAAEDLQTRYQLARVQHRLGKAREALEGYKAVSEKGYAIAMRGMGILLSENPELATAEIGTPDDWRLKAARAGDDASLPWLAVEAAINENDPDFATTAFSMLTTMGYKNAAEASLNLSNWITEKGKDKIAAERALFFAILGRELARRQANQPDFNDERLRRMAPQMVRDRLQPVDPARATEIWRQAIAWRAGQGG